jgi:DNA repair exonuclease SbcCD ATPase subunit
VDIASTPVYAGTWPSGLGNCFNSRQCSTMLTPVLATIAGILAIASIALAFLWASSTKKLRKVNDLEKHAQEIKAACDAKLLEIEKINADIGKQKQVFKTYVEVVGVVKNAAEAQQKLNTIKNDISQASKVLGVAQSALEFTQKLAQAKEQLAKYQEAIGPIKSVNDAMEKKREIESAIEQSQSSATQKLKAIEAECIRVKDELEIAIETNEMQSYGFYNRVFDFETPQRYMQELDRNAERQKNMIKAGIACMCSTQWRVEGSTAKGDKMAKEQIKLMLRAFNGECDAAISKVKHNNFGTIKTRIEKAFDALNKLGQTKQIAISGDYLKLRVDELILTHELELAKEEEKERQKEIRERIKEEEKALREIEEAKKKAEKDETAKTKALEEARRQLAEEHGLHNEKLESLIAKLENELKDAIDRKAKAIARAQLTKSGHVYVLSNIGTMGDGVYKIGMTRRFEPLERIKELGDASVPFPFDVHALIYTENAPKLENDLHRHFAERRLNLSNNRKEYFRVTLEEVCEAVKTYFGEVTFRTDHEALQYRESEEIRRKGLASEVPLSDDEGTGD